METQNRNGKGLRIAKLFRFIALIMIGLFASILFGSSEMLDYSLGFDTQTTQIITIVGVIFAILGLWSVYKVTGFIIKAGFKSAPTKKRKMFFNVPGIQVR